MKKYQITQWIHHFLTEHIKEGALCIDATAGGDHSVATGADTSVAAIDQGLSLLKLNGLMSVCIYSGKDSGFAERNAVLKFLKGLDSRKYMVILSSYYNRPKHPPIPVLIYKLKP